MSSMTPTSKTAPGPQGAFLIGSILDLQRQDMIEFYMNYWKEYGDIVRFKMGPIDTFLLAHPDDIHHVLINNSDNYTKGMSMDKLKLSLGEGLFAAEGELWRQQRQIMQPMFTPRAVDHFAPAMLLDIQKMLGRWQTEYGAGQTFDVAQEMMRLAMGIIARTMFSLDIDGDQRAVAAGQAFTHVLEFASKQTSRILDIPLFIPTPANRRFKKSQELLDDFIYDIIGQRRRQSNGQKRNDLLDILMRARDPETGQPMSDKQLHDEVITIFFAGHETTAQALTWTWLLLSQHPQVEERLVQELKEVLNGSLPTVDDVPQLTYTRMVIDEAMRIYPPIWIYARQAIEDDLISGYHIPAGSMITLSQYITHRHPDFWDRPQQFNPLNFSPEKAAQRPRYAYFPFGGGRRICIGNSFALLEAVLALSAFAQHYRVKLLPGQEIKPKMVGTLRPDKEVMVTLQER